MSGGSFDYAYGRTQHFADELKNKLDERGKINEWGEMPYNFRDDVIATLEDIHKLAEMAARMMKEAEWLYSGDTGEDTFMARVKEIGK